MKVQVKVFGTFLVLVVAALVCSSFTKPEPAKIFFPYKRSGLNEQQAAAHLLSRFTYGARPGDVDALLAVGLEKWFMQQLEGGLPDDSLNLKLLRYPNINLSNQEVGDKFPRNAKLVRMAIRDGAVHKDSVNKGDRTEYRRMLQEYRDKHGLGTEQELFREFISQKVLRASYSNNQLSEMLTDFWFNHFNVSLTKGQCAAYVPAFERDVIRPNVTGKFSDLLLATAKSPAMLLYLDNATSSGTKAKGARKGGLNENYAREVMELHTLGVDGGYTQNDVTEAARVLTGWGVSPEDEFRFAAARHDQAEKTVLGKTFAAGGGYEEGVQLLQMLASQPATAKFISHKIAVRFVKDDPDRKLVDKMAKTFMQSGGDIRQVLITMVSDPGFWSKDALREKTKSPFEYAISAVRTLDAKIEQPYQIYNWVNRMGQKIYYYQAPTGFPDKAQYWISTGALLSRMNFALALTGERIPGVKVNLLAASPSKNAREVGVHIGSPEFQRK
ncbi:DUF1800 domain-containing protein [Pedobacter deserti]|uniref:DUF1800 domain-containing protein n=1 Tax=Pedobacter deserti TaxID=2817382 RepID=UPI00210BC302|nr:DUF1800 domain-containing protein [Pedobacter sp. SYSU D00382]